MDFIYGMTQGFLAPQGYYLSAEGEKSVERLKEHGVNFVALVVNQFLETFHSTRIFPLNSRTQDDDELALHIDRLHKAGIRVMLKPMIDPLDSVWRGNIRQYRGIRIFADIDSDTVTPWFLSYREFINRYAKLAEKCQCEFFCAGCELDGMEEHSAEWSETIRQIRELYHGTVITIRQLILNSGITENGSKKLIWSAFPATSKLVPMTVPLHLKRCGRAGFHGWKN